MCSEVITTAFHVTKEVWNTIKRKDDTAAAGTHVHEDVHAQLQQMLEIALDSPRQLLVGQHAQAFRRLLQRLHRRHTSSGDLPWQLVLIHQRLDAAIEVMSYEEMSMLFEGNPPPQPLSEGSLRKLPKIRVTRRELEQGLGSGHDTQCPICLEDFQCSHRICALPPCGHCLHASCVGQWLRLQGSCPVCRQLVQLP